MMSLYEWHLLSSLITLRVPVKSHDYYAEQSSVVLAFALRMFTNMFLISVISRLWEEILLTKSWRKGRYEGVQDIRLCIDLLSGSL